MVAFDTETVEGEPLTLQTADARGAELVYVSRADILPVFLNALRRRGASSGPNLAWAHHLEFDFGVVFIEEPWIWKARKGHIRTVLSDGTAVELTYHHLNNPFHHLIIGEQHWLLLDTMSFIKRSLDTACKLLGLSVQKLPRPAYLGSRPPTLAERPAFEAYAKNDALATYALAEYLATRHQMLSVGPTVSIAQLASSVLRTRFLGQSPDKALRTQVRTLSPVVVAQRKKMLRPHLRVSVGSGIPFCETEPGSNTLLEASCLAFHGGKNGLYVRPGVYEDVTEIDIVSAYPHAMTALPPLTRGRWKRTREYSPGSAAIYKIRGTVNGRCPFGVFMDPSGTQFFREGSFDTWVTGWELAAAQHEISIHALDDGYVWHPGSGARNPLAEYVSFFFQKKRDTPKSDPWYEMYKLLLNSLYGKLIQLTQDVDSSLGVPQRVAGGLFNPFWAGQITGHCRARLHGLEHRYAALHASTDSVLTHSRDIPTGLSDLGHLEVKASGRLVVLRKRLYFIVDDSGAVKKQALNGFHGKTAQELLSLVLRGGGPYRARHMVRPREAVRSGEKPFQMIMRQYHLHLPEALLTQIGDAWKACQARRFIPFP
jgi:hypothetical protein